jgi:hypothetical protein
VGARGQSAGEVSCRRSVMQEKCLAGEVSCRRSVMQEKCHAGEVSCRRSVLQEKCHAGEVSCRRSVLHGGGRCVTCDCAASCCELLWSQLATLL